jgi:hypothetical protein
METLDLSVPRPMPGIEEAEFHVTRNFTYFARVVRNVRKIGVLIRNSFSLTHRSMRG